MSYSYIPPPSNFTKGPPTPISCTRCRETFNTANPFFMTCPACHRRDIDYTVKLGNKIRIQQINVALLNLAVELSLATISNDRKDVLEKLVAQLEKEKLDLLKNV